MLDLKIFFFRGKCVPLQNNEEVRKSLMLHLVGSYAECPVSDTTELRDYMLQQLFDGDVSAF